MTHKVHKGILHPIAKVHSTHYTGSYKRCIFYSYTKKICCNSQSAKHNNSCSRRCDLWEDKQGNAAKPKEKTSSSRTKYDFTLKKVFTSRDGETNVKIKHHECTEAAAKKILKKAAGIYKAEAGWENILMESDGKQYDHAHGWFVYKMNAQIGSMKITLIQGDEIHQSQPAIRALTAAEMARANARNSKNKDSFERALWEADHGNIQAMYQVGQYYESGKGVETDYAKAMRWYKSAFFAGKKYGAVAVGNLYEKGLGVEKNLKKALSWYKRGAAVNEPGARKRAKAVRKLMNQLVRVVVPPRIIPPPKNKRDRGTNLLNFAIDAYRQQRWERAYKYFKLAAQNGKVHAFHQLADMYYKGKGLPEADYKKAFEYYKLAAAQKSGYAMYRLGRMYLRGEGVEPSKLDALTWLGNAVNAGYKNAKDDYKRVRDELQLADIIPVAETV